MTGNIVALSPDNNRLDVLRRAAPPGVEVDWVDSTLPLEEQAAQLRDTVVIIGAPSPELARVCAKLKLVQTTSAGTDRMDVVALGEMGIKVANGGGGNAVAVSEHTIALMLSVYRKLHLQFQSVRSGKWSSGIRSDWFSQAHELTGRTVGIVGFGRIGQEVAKRLRGWDCVILYQDAIARPPEVEEEFQATRVPLDKLLKTSDVVTLHVPLTGRTRGMIGEDELAMMKPTAVLINACRGKVVDEAALVKALRQGKIAGAGLDVLEEEPTPADNPLLDMDNVAVTPHMASFSQESAEKSSAFAVRNAARVVSGLEPESVVLPEWGGLPD